MRQQRMHTPSLREARDGWGSHRGVCRFLSASFFSSCSRCGEQKQG